MSREEEISKFAYDYSKQNYKGDSYEAYAEKEDIAKACIDSINWADQHPRKGLVDIEKACKWIEENIYDYYTTGDGGDEFEEYFDQMIDDFRKAMEE